MLTLFGDILNWLAAGALFPAMMLPLASLARTRTASALLWIALVVVVIAASSAFAVLAVDLNPPTFSPGLLISMLGGLAIGGSAVIAMGASQIIAGIVPSIENFVKSVGRLSLYLIAAMALIQFAIVILRYVFGLNFIAMQESVTYMHGAVFLLAGGYALLTDDHVRVDIFYREARPRKKALIDLAGTYIFLFPFCFVALWAAGPYVANSWSVHEGSMEQSGIKGVYLLKTLIPAYLLLLLLAGFVVAARAAHTLKIRSD